MKKLFKNMKENEKGFTLIELIVVIAIIGILAAVLLPKFAGFTDKAKENAVKSEAKNVYTVYAACQAELGTVTSQNIIDNLGKKPQGINDAAGITVNQATPEKIITYIAKVSGKEFTVDIKDGGEITLIKK